MSFKTFIKQKVKQLTKATKDESKNIIRDLKAYPTKNKSEDRAVKAIEAESEIFRTKNNQIGTTKIGGDEAKGLGYNLDLGTGKLTKPKGEKVSSFQAQLEVKPASIKKRQEKAKDKGKDPRNVKTKGTIRKSLPQKTGENIKKKVKETKVRRRIRKTAAAALPLAIVGPELLKQKDKTMPSASAKDTKTSKNYKVKSGDTISEIARDKGTTVGKIKKANPNIKNLNKIKPGQTIKIPMPKVKNRKSVYQDLTRAEMKKIAMKKRAGGPLRPIPAGNKGLPNLPTPVRNKMGFKKRGGAVVKRAVGGGVALRGLGAVRKV